ncbi:hypothetical protein [Hafnia alvei]|uniref:hypothetical protein n=1 Tax=Hafnia alvei TaxID=569 RepID=UPI000E056C99|nr:hypothetical protein [Hafnia alvei]STQ71813.1 Uncharacterised protein [Hafnia alvei]
MKRKDWFTAKEVIKGTTITSSPDKAWLNIFNQMSQDEQIFLTDFTMREGINTLLQCLHANDG